MNKNIAAMDAIYKDDSPIKTVEKIRGILNSHGLKPIETWFPTGVEHCYALRLDIDNTRFGSNGKGLTKEFALASAYGELMERLQLGLLADSSVQKLGHYTQVTGKEEDLPPSTLYNYLPSWYEYLADNINKIDKTDFNGMDVLNRFAHANGTLPSTPFYSLMSGEKIYVPKEIRSPLCGSNGGAAGNTTEEAIVQAISEIVERYFKKKILLEQICPPQIPDHVLQKFPTAYEIISKLRNSGFKVLVKDCSLGTQFPVVCVCFIDQKTGKYHSHFGACPVLEIAIERTITESFQGKTLDNFTNNESFVYANENLSSFSLIYKDMKKGNSEKPPNFFVGECKYEYNENVGFKGKNNKELLKELVEYFANEGKEIYVRDASCLGFPTYNVFIPGYSEIFFHNISKKNNNFEHAAVATKALKNPSTADFDELLRLLSHVGKMQKLASSYPRLYTLSTCAALPLKCTNGEDTFVFFSTLGFAYYYLGKYENALNCVQSAQKFAPKNMESYILCLNRYLSMLVSGHSDEEIKKLLSFFHGEELSCQLLKIIESGENPFKKFVLCCDEKNCDGCILENCCYQKYTLTIVNLISQKTKELDDGDLLNKIDIYKLNS